MADLRVGLIGAGMVARHHAKAWARCARAGLVAIADPDVAAAADLSQGKATVHETLGALLAEASVDVIDIASPVATHAPLVREAVAAGLPVLCQKPLAPTARQAERLVSDLPPDARVMLHENWRWRPSYRTLKPWLRERRMPDYFDLTCESSGLCPTATGRIPALDRQPFLARLDRLVVFELLGHHLDVLAFLFGPVEILGAETRHQSASVAGEDFARVDLVAGGVAGSLAGNFAAQAAPPRPRDRLSLDGGVVLDDWRLNLGGQLWDWDHDAAYQQSYDACIGHFARCILHDLPFETPVGHGVTLLNLIEEIYHHAENSSRGASK